MSLEDFNRGLDDTCEGNFRSKFADNPDYIEGITQFDKYIKIIIR